MKTDANDILRKHGSDALREALDNAIDPFADEKLNGSVGNGSAAHSSRIHLVPFEQIVLGRQRRYLVKGLIPRVGLTVVWGPPKCGKSFWTFDLAMHVALGWEYRGRRVQQGPVV